MEPLWCAKDVAEFLGLSEKTVYRLAAEGRLPSIRFTDRGAVRFDKKDIFRLVQSQKREVHNPG